MLAIQTIKKKRWNFHYKSSQPFLWNKTKKKAGIFHGENETTHTKSNYTVHSLTKKNKNKAQKRLSELECWVSKMFQDRRWWTWLERSHFYTPTQCMKMTITRGRDTKMHDCLKKTNTKMTMLVTLKSIIWNGDACTTVHLQLPLHLTDRPLFSVSGPGAAVGKQRNKRLKARKSYWAKHHNILGTS